MGVPETVPESSVDTDLAKKDLNSNSANVQKLEVKEQEQEKPKEEAVKELKTKKNPVQAKETPKSKGISFLSLSIFILAVGKPMVRPFWSPRITSPGN